MDISPSQIITELLQVENGIFAGGWLLAGYLLWKTLAKKDEKTAEITELIKAHNQETQTLRATHEEKVDAIRQTYENQIMELRKFHDARVNEIEDELDARLKEATDRIYELSQAHIKLISDISEKRIEDMKSITEDYNAMAESVRQAIEKLTAMFARKTKG